MRIAVIGSASKPVSDQAAGGVEVWTALFLKEAVKYGHTFDLYSLKGSLAIPGKVKLVKVTNKGLDEIKALDSFKTLYRREYDLNSLFGIFFSRVLLQIRLAETKYDLVINSSGSPIIPINWDLFDTPLLTIGHFAAWEPYVGYFKYFPLPKNIYYVFPSLREYHLATEIPKKQKFCIPHGIDIKKIPFENTFRENLLWLGRLDPTMDKGAADAIRIANKMRLPLDVFTHIEDQNYFNQVIKPLFTKYVSFKTDRPRKEYFKKAKVFIVPLGWEEPFGLTIIEAMSSGTPVIAYAKGALPETIQDGVTGFLINPSKKDIRGSFIVKKEGLEGLEEAIEKVYALSKTDYQDLQEACRQWAESNFTVGKMVNSYEKVIQKISKIK